MTRKRKISGASAGGKSLDAKGKRPSYSEPKKGPFGIAREWVDTLIFAYLLAMFIRTFVIELFKIPTGSMTPTLVGDQVNEIVEVDVNGDGHNDLVVNRPGRKQVFYHDGEAYHGYDEISALPPNVTPSIRGMRCDRICVNKLAYLFSPPERGDIAVFKVPKSEFQTDKPIYVKRVCVLPNEHVDIPEDGRLTIDGQAVTEPEIYLERHYTNMGLGHGFLPWKLADEQFMMFGDNTTNSSDSRTWGPVPGINFKGKAFLRYWPIFYLPGDSRLSRILGAGKIANFGLLEQSHSKLRWILFGAYLVFLYFAIRLYSRIDQRWRTLLQPS